MDRRRPRFAPQNETLEPRQLLATTAAAAATVRAASDVPLSTYALRQQRIDRLPAFLATNQPGRVIPTEVTAPIQDALRGMIGRLGSATPAGLRAFNQQLRSVLSRDSINANDYNGLLSLFERNLNDAGVGRTTSSTLRASMAELGRQTIATVPNPTSAVANDVSLVLQLALAVGKPLAAPRVPTLTAGSSVSGRPNATRNRQPTLTGTYEPDMTVSLRDVGSGRILGSAATDANGRFNLRPDAPLAIGTHRFRLLGFGPGGIASQASRVFSIVVIQPVPGGPRALG